MNQLPLWVQIIGALAAAAALIAGPFISIKVSSNTSRASREGNANTHTDNLIVRLQEDRKADREHHRVEIERIVTEHAADKKEYDEALLKVETTSARVERKVYILEDYVSKLRRHIEEGKPPPPPEFPRELLNQ